MALGNNISAINENLKKSLIIIVFLLSTAVAFYFRIPYVHMAMEIFSVAITCVIFILTWYNRKLKPLFFYVFLGIVYLQTGLFTFFHTLTFGLSFQELLPDQFNLSSQLWLYSRILESLGLLLAIAFFSRRSKPFLLFVLGAAVSLLGILFIFILKIFPRSIGMDGHYNALFSLILLICSLITTTALFRLMPLKKVMGIDMFSAVFYTGFFSILADAAILFSNQDSSLVDVLGHSLKFLAFFFLNDGLIKTIIQKPHKTLFQSLNRRIEQLADRMDNGYALIRQEKEDIGKGIYWITDYNKSFESLFPQCSGTKIPFSDIFPDSFLNYIDEVLTEKESQHFEYLPEDTHSVFQITLFPFEKDTLGISVIDITANRTLLSQARQAEKMSAIGQLAGGVAHDYNNQLSSIDSCLSLIEEKVGSEEVQNDILRIKKSVQRASYLTKQLLSFSRKQIEEVRPLDLHSVVNEAADILRLSTGRRISIHCNLHSERTILKGDESSLENALLNLGINARDAMNSHGDITFSTREISITETTPTRFSYQLKPGPHIRLDIDDTGPGIADELREKIFDPYFTTKEKGTGMGLSMVYRTVELHKGDVWVERNEAGGARFSMVFPVTNLKEEVKKQEKEPIPQAERNETGFFVIVDDEDIYLNAVIGTLRKHGYKVHGFSRGEDAIRFISEHHQEISLIFLDYLLDDYTGKELAEQIFQINPEKKILILTGYIEEGDRKDLLDMGVKEVLIKPVPIRTLESFIQKYST